MGVCETERPTDPAAGRIRSQVEDRTRGGRSIEQTKGRCATLLTDERGLPLELVATQSARRTPLTAGTDERRQEVSVTSRVDVLHQRSPL